MEFPSTTNSTIDSNYKFPQDSSMIQVSCGFLVLLLQLGLQLVEAGSIRSKNTSTVFMRGLACLTISVVITWVCGYSFTFSPGHYLLGYDSNWFGLHKVGNAVQAHWFLHAAVSSLPSSIIAASMTERSHLTGHLVLAAVLAGVVYPLPAHWVWHQQGWLHMKGCRDVGGVIVVHLFSGFGALVGSLLVGPRVERLGNNFRDTAVPGHSLPLVAVGGMMVLVGIVAKVVGLVDKYEQIGPVAANSLIGGAGGGVVAMSLSKLIEGKVSMSRQTRDYNKNMVTVNRRWSYLTSYNGVLSGMVSVCGVGSTLPTWAALISGIVGGFAFFMLSLLLKINKVDDPVSGVAVNLSGGLVGSLVTGLALLAETHDGMVVGWQLVGVVVVSAWVVTLCLVIMLPLLLCGKLRIKDSHEKLGVDCVKVFEEAYSLPLNDEKSFPPGCRDLKTRSVVGGNERDRSPVCAFVTPSIREQLVGTSPLTSTSKVYLSNTINKWSMDTEATTPRIVMERPSPATSLQSLVPPPPPSYANTKSPHSTQLETSLTVPEISVTASDTSSQDNSQTPLLSNSGQANHSIAFDVKELRVALKEQRGRLKNTNSLLKSPGSRSVSVGEEYDQQGNNSISSAGSDISVKSEVVRQTVKTASNKENFNYLAGSKKLDADIDDAVGRQTDPLKVNDTRSENSSVIEVKEKGLESLKEAVCDESVKGEQDFDYSKKDIDDGLAQVSHVEVKDSDENGSVIDSEDGNEKRQESGLI